MAWPLIIGAVVSIASAAMQANAQKKAGAQQASVAGKAQLADIGKTQPVSLTGGAEDTSYQVGGAAPGQPKQRLAGAVEATGYPNTGWQNPYTRSA